MFKKKDIIIAVVLVFFLVAVITIFVLNRQQLKIGNTNAYIDNSTRQIYVSLPAGSSTVQKIYFNFFFKNQSLFIKKISSGSNEEPDSLQKTSLKSGDYFDFGSYISHLKLIIGSGNSSTEYDMWVTTGELPIIKIETENIIKDEPKSDCKISIFSNRHDQNLNLAASEIEITDVVKDDQKYSYSLNIKEDQLIGDVPRILDFELSKRFSLSALNNDKSFSRQKLVYDIFKTISKQNSNTDSRFVELYLNEEYQGIYLLSRRVDRQLLELEAYSEKEPLHSVIYEASGKEADFSNKTAGFSQIQPDYKNDISYFGPLERLIDFVTNKDKQLFLEKANEIIDINNLIDNHILFLLSGSANKLASNQYIYHGNKASDKFKFYPGDFYNYSFGNDLSFNNINAEEIFYPTTLYNKLYEDDVYRNNLKKRWNDLRKDIITYDNLASLIDDSVLKITNAVKRDYSKWTNTPAEKANDNSFNSFNAEIDCLKEYIYKRLLYLDNYFNFPPLIKIGDNFAKINEQTHTIFCALPKGSDTSQVISWYFSEATEISIERIPISSSPLGKYLKQKDINNSYNTYNTLIDNSINTGNISIYIDHITKNTEEEHVLQIAGWAIDRSNTQDTGIKQILLFDGLTMRRETFLGEATSGLPREDVASHFNNASYKYCGFEIYINTLSLENGFHNLYLYVFDKIGNYTLKKIEIEINNDEDLVNDIKKSEKNLKKQLVNAEEYDFYEYIFHGKLTIKDNNKLKEYDLYVTTSDIPVAVIYTGNNPIPQTKKIDASLQIMHNDSNKNNFIDSQVFDFYERIGIQLRGQTSLAFPKKQYSFEIRDKNGEDKNASILGLPSESDWIFGAPYSDKTLIRNVLAYNISNEIGLYASRTRFVEVFLDMPSLGVDYKGLYFLAEKIKRDIDRVDVEIMDSDDVAILPGGYILEMSSDDKIKPQDSFIVTERGLKLINIYPKSDSISQKQKIWITYYINEFEQVLYSDDFKDAEDGYRKYIDVDSFVDYLIINELFKNVEAFTSSTFLYKGRYEKLKAGPVWDFNTSTGNTTYRPSSTNTPIDWVHLDGNWKERFFKDEYFVKKYINRWKQIRKNILSNENIINIIETQEELISEAQIRNFKRWDILGKYIWPNPEPIASTHEEEIENLKNWLLDRSEWIDENINILEDAAELLLNNNNIKTLDDAFEMLEQATE